MSDLPPLRPDLTVNPGLAGQMLALLINPPALMRRILPVRF